MTLEEILKERDKYEINTGLWRDWNAKKAELLEKLKPSTREEIIYHFENTLNFMPEGFSNSSILFPIEYYLQLLSSIFP
jgi:hypothetical protein